MAVRREGGVGRSRDAPIVGGDEGVVVDHGLDEPLQVEEQAVRTEVKPAVESASYSMKGRLPKDSAQRAAVIAWREAERERRATENAAGHAHL